MARHGMTINDETVKGLLQLFKAIDRGSDPRVIAKGEPIRRFRASLVRISTGKRIKLFDRRCSCKRKGRASCVVHGSDEEAEEMRYG